MQSHELRRHSRWPLPSRLWAHGQRSRGWRLASLVAVLGFVIGCQRDADQHLNQGDDLLARGSTERALAEYLEALRLEPSLRAERGAGLAYAALGSLEQAEQHLSLALSVQPGDTATRLALIDVYGESGREEDARKHLASLLEDQPYHAGALLLVGGYAQTPAEARQAISLLERAVERHKLRGVSVDREMQILLADLYARDGRTDLAESYRRSARLATLGGELQTLELSRLCVKQRRFAVAYELLLAVLEKRPSDVEGLLLLASAALELGHVAEAQATFARLPKERQEQADARLLGARIDLGAELQVQAARELESLLPLVQQSRPPLVRRVRLALAQALIAQQRLADAGAELRRLIAEAPDALDARVRLAKLELDQGQPQVAVDCLTPLPEVHPELGSAFDILGRAELAQGNSAAAEASFRQVVTLAPERPEGRYGVARALLLRGEGALARPLLEDNLQRFVAHRPSLLTLGELIRKGEGQKASDAFMLKYWAKHPESAAVAALEGDWESSRQRPARALAAYQRALTLEPDFLPAARALGHFYSRRKLATQAFSVIDAALSQSPQAAELLLLGADVASELRDYGRARQHLERLLTLLPDHPQALAQLSRIEAESGGDLLAAQRLAERAHASAPGNADVLDALGWVSHLNHDSAQAIERLQASVSIDPTDPRSQYHLAAAALARADIALAQQSLRRVFALDPGFPDSAALRGRVAMPPSKRETGPHSARRLRR